MTDSQGGRTALLVANGVYNNRAFRQLRSPRQDCAGLAAVLGDPAIGGFGVEQLVDATSYEVRRALERFFRNRGRGDTLLLYLSCHGIKDDEGHLHFAASDTDKDLPASTAVSATFLHDLMDRCRARTIVVLLDCCYSGAFLPGAKGDDYVGVKEELSGRGRVVLTATNRTEYAWEGTHLEMSQPQPSRFTGALIEGLSSGAADGDGDGLISVTELYDYVYEAVRGAGVRQTPRMWADLEYRVTIARTALDAARDAGAGARGSSDAANENFSDIMDAFFGAAAQRGPTSRTRRGQDAMIRLEIDLNEAAFGTTKEIQVDTATVCTTCSGEGAAPGTSAQTCDMCRGRGEVSQVTRSFLGRVKAPRPCPQCRGIGTVIPTPCPECASDGRVRTRRTLTIKIPAGVDNGTRIRFAGEGEVGPGGGPAADLYVELVERPHPELERRGDDLHLTRGVPRELAGRGGTIEVPTLDGVKTVRIPKGHRTGILRLRGLGVTHLRGAGRGDLLIHVKVDE